MTAGPVSGSGRGNVYPNYGLPATPSSSSGRPAMDLSMRAANVDRERAIDVLRSGFAEGRLTKEEHDERVAKVYDSRTYGDLAALTSDLPAGPMPFASVAQPQHVVVAARRTNAMAVAALICGFFVPFGTLPAVVLGHAARAQIRRTGEGGDGLAIGGLILGWGAIALFAVFFVLVSVATARGQGAVPGGVHTVPVIIHGNG